MAKSKLNRAVELLTSECVATFEYTLGWDASIFRAPIRLAISNTISEVTQRDIFVEDVLARLKNYESVD